MREINIEFQEEYKRLDRICRDMYAAHEGVSAYISAMESTFDREKFLIPEWEGVYKRLKNLRWKRNQLAHEVSVDSDLCTGGDVEWIRCFCVGLLNCTDPLARLAQLRRQRAEKQTTRTASTPMQSPNPSPVQAPTSKPKGQSLWVRVVSAVKGWFS